MTDNRTIILRGEVQRKFALDFIAGLIIDPKRLFSIVIAPYKKNRSLDQNNLYWKWIGIIARESGNDPEHTHDALKQRFLLPVFVSIGTMTFEVRSTKKLKVAEMSEYMTAVQAMAATELGLVLPVPEDLGRE